jgi:hypothetical protein
MRSPIALVALVFALPLHAQPAQDAKLPEQHNTQGATQNSDAIDPATKARVRTEGVPGGTGARVPAEPQIGQPREEKSSERNEGRSASGATR